VTVSGADYRIVDIGMRMLQPDELLRAQFGRFAEGYDLSAARTKSAKVRLIGNSVCPELAEAIVAANIDRGAMRAA
jgi:DNA (cytosine-5)-methyltransferase 1